MTTSNNLCDLPNSQLLDESFDVEQSSNNTEEFSNVGGAPPVPHRPRMRVDARGFGFRPAMYPYPIFPPQVVYTQPARRINITKWGLSLLKDKKAKNIIGYREFELLDKVSDGRQFLLEDIKRSLGYPDFDVILNWLQSKGYIYVI